MAYKCFFFPKRPSYTKHTTSLVGNHHAMLLTLENAVLILIMCDLFSSLYFYCKPNCMDAQTQIVHQCHWKDSLVLSELIQANKHPRLELGTPSSSDCAQGVSICKPGSIKLDPIPIHSMANPYGAPSKATGCSCFHMQKIAVL